MSTIRKLLKDESGATAIEYGLIAALVAVALITILGTMSASLQGTFQNISDSLNGANTPTPAP